jgi:hypothetical protein
MARQPKPKALSPLQSDQRSYTSELLESCWWVSWVEWVGIQGRKGTWSSPVARVAAVTKAAELLWYIQSWVVRLRKSGETQLYCTWVYDCNKSNYQSNTRLHSLNAWQYWGTSKISVGNVMGKICHFLSLAMVFTEFFFPFVHYYTL